MRSSSLKLRCVQWVPIVALAMAPACQDDAPGDGTETTTTATSEATLAPQPTGNDDTDSATGVDPTRADDSTGRPSGGECEYFEQDCPDGEKCVPWSALPDLVPDEQRCCPIGEPVAQPGDECAVEGYFGSCLDNCAAGSLCLDVDNDGEGLCQELCGGTPEQPECTDSDTECFVYFGGVPLCFYTCDPLVQGCQSNFGCYPDAIAEGGTGFLCMPTIGDNVLGDYCWLLAGCNPGMICAFPDLLPNCFGNAGDSGCCTDLCDITESPDGCTNIHPDLECVPWYHQGSPPPSADLQNVGACVLPTVGSG